MINSYQEISTYEENEWQNFLDRLDLYEIFKPIFSLSSDPQTIGGIVRYIAWTYTKTSEKVIVNMSWEKNKSKNFDDTFLPKEWKERLTQIKDPEVVSVIEAWLSYQDEETFSQMVTLKDLRSQMQKSCVSDIKKGNGSEIDYDQKFKNAEYVLDLQKMIKELENELIQNHPKLKSVVSDFAAKKKNTFGVENYAK